MRFLIVNIDYPAFLRDFYRSQPGLATASYDQQMRALVGRLFGVADFYPTALRALGHEAHEVYVNNMHLQKAWAREHGLKLWAPWPWPFYHRRAFLPGAAPWFHPILRAQIEHYQPDVVLNHAIGIVSCRFWSNVRSRFRLLVGQLAAPFSPRENFGCYDLMLSSLPPFVDHFQQHGVRAELFRLGFSPAVLEQLGAQPLEHDVTFVGSLSPDHADRIAWLESLCRALPVKVWGPGAGHLPAGSPIRRAHQGPLWGLDMYRVLQQSRITLNHHIGIAGRMANNMRLYEATGVGTLLATDWKENLHEMFEPGKEVVTYRDVDECIAQVRYYLDHEAERQAIARAGQARTLREHTYARRMEQLVQIVERYL